MTGEGSERNPMISFPFSILLFVVFISAIFESQGWPSSVKEFPVTASIPGAFLVFLALLKDGQGYIATLREHGSFLAAWKFTAEKVLLYRASVFFSYLVGMILVMLVVHLVRLISMWQKIVLSTILLKKMQWIN